MAERSHLATLTPGKLYGMLLASLCLVRATMNRNHSAVIAVHAPIYDGVINNNQPVRARVCPCVPVALNGLASRWPAVVVYWLVKVGRLAISTGVRDTFRLGSVKPVDLIVVLFNYGRRSTLHIKELLDGRSHPTIHCGRM